MYVKDAFDIETNFFYGVIGLGSGLSMASVNKIKELAENQQYEMAVDILDSQNLEKSLNPQFIRTCGEIYENVGRLTDARRLYVKAHIMAPESNRIIFSIVLYYLKRGYFSLAKQYANQYMFNDKKEQAAYNMNYLLDKARRVSCKELLPRIYPLYMHEMDEFWSYELFLLAKLLGKADVSDNISSDYRATYRNSVFSNNINLVDNGFKNAEEYFYTFPETELPDSAEDEEEIREQEKKQLETDYRRMHPEEFEAKEAVFLTMEDVDPEAEAKSVEEEINSRKKGLFGKLFGRNKKAKAEADETAEASSEEENEIKKDDSSSESGSNENAEEHKSEEGSSEERSEESKEEASADNVQESELKTVENSTAAEGDTSENDTDEEEDTTYDGERSFNVMSVEDAITYDYDDGFAPESEMISDIEDDTSETDYFDTVSLFEFDETEEQETSYQEPLKEEPVFKETEAAFEPLEEAVNEAVEETVEETVEEAVEETVEETVEEAVEEAVEETVEEAVEEAAEENKEEAVEETVEEIEEEAVEETVEETEEETVEETVEDTVNETAEESAEETEEESVEETVEETVAEAVEETVEDTVEETVEETAEDIEEAVVEETAEEETAEETAEESAEETEEESVEDIVEDIEEAVVEETVEVVEEAAVVETAEDIVEDIEETVAEEAAVDTSEETAEETAEEFEDDSEAEAEDAVVDEVVDEEAVVEGAVAEEFTDEDIADEEPADEEEQLIGEETVSVEPESKFRYHDYESDEIRRKYESYKDIDYSVDTSDVRFELPEFKSSIFEGVDISEKSVSSKVTDNGYKTEKIEELDTKLKEEERLQREAEELLKSLGIDI